MSTFKKFEEIEVWQKARALCHKLYSITKTPNFNDDRDLKWQINKTAGSVMDNIAEGYERGGKNEFVQFLSISKGSVGELRSQLYRAIDRELISQADFEEMHSMAIEISRMLEGLMSYLKKSNIKGPKYKL
jgi:four helix bundle protein